MSDDDDDFDDVTVMGQVPVSARTRARDRAYLIVLAGAQVGEMFKVEGEMIIGRGQDAAVRVIDDQASRQHVRLRLENGQVVLEDLGSRNGTLVNGERVARQVLADGDKIQVGITTILKFTYHDELDDTFSRRMFDSALRDPLTKAFNKRSFDERLATEVSFTKRHGTPLSLVMFDLDHFRNVNNTRGHLAGDFVLTTLVHVVGAQLRAEDMLSRWGGEEFAILLRGTPGDASTLLAERVRAAVEAHAFVHEGARIPVTMSAGIASMPNPKLQLPNELIAAADEALYAAKNGGRNRVVRSALG